jgi:hypothetical protein
MRERLVAVTVRVRLRVAHGRIVRSVLVLVMRIVDVCVLVIHCLVRMHVLMSLRKV